MDKYTIPLIRDTSKRMGFLQVFFFFCLFTFIFSPVAHLHQAFLQKQCFTQLSMFFAHCRYLLNVFVTEFQIIENFYLGTIWYLQPRNQSMF